MRLRRFQDERGGDIAGEFLDIADRDTGRIKRQVIIEKELSFGTFDRGGICEIEITLPDQPTARVFLCRSNRSWREHEAFSNKGSSSSPVIRNVDDCLLALVADKFDLILDGEYGLGASRVQVLLACDIPDSHLNGARIALLAILAEVLE